MNWKIGGKAKALVDIILVKYRNVSTAREVKHVVFQNQEYKVKDVITFKCGQYIDIGISGEKDTLVKLIACPYCYKDHIVKKEKGKFIYFPGCWFIKPDKDWLLKRAMRRIKKALGKGHSIKELVQFPIPKTKEMPERLHRKKRTKQTEEA